MAIQQLSAFDEAFLRQEHAAVLAGVDEAGRGPWAGPVVAAAVILPSGISLPGLNDSKLLTYTQRETLYSLITGQALSWAVALGDALLIDQINIAQATYQAMVEAIGKLSMPISHVLIDGYPLPKRLCQGVPWTQRGVIQGDRKSASIAAASILAKVTRDRMMLEWDRVYPAYGFARHKGYGTPEHARALAQYGPCPLHRRSFAPVRNAAARVPA